MAKLRIIVPIFNDWDSLGILLRDLDRVAAGLPVRVAVSVIDDGSTVLPPPEFHEATDFSNLDSVEIIHLCTNVGHQRAIAIGLTDTAHNICNEYRSFSV